MTQSVHTSTPSSTVKLFWSLTVAATAAFAALAPMTALADEVNVDKYDVVLSGNVRLGDVPLENALVIVESGDYTVVVETDAAGKWRAGVPTKDAFDVTLVSSSVPAGAAPPAEYDDQYSVTSRGMTISGEFGLTNDKAVNFFLELDESVVTAEANEWLGWVLLAVAATAVVALILTVGLLIGRRQRARATLDSSQTGSSDS